MKRKALLVWMISTTAYAFAQSYSTVVEVRNVTLEEKSSENCTVTFRFTNNNSYTVDIKYKTVTYSQAGQSFPDSGRLYLNPGQSDETTREYGAFSKCSVTRVSGDMTVTEQP